MSERQSGGEERTPSERAESAGGRAGESAESRDGIPGKGFDAGTGYGGAGADSAYQGESSFGGQAGYGGSTTRGAYGGGKYGRADDPEGADAGGEGANPSAPTAEEGAESEDELGASG